MKNHTISFRNLLFKISLAFILSSAGLMSAPYETGGKSIEWVQPDGTEIKLKVIGSFNYARTETTDGYTVIHDPNDQTYYYAKLNKKQDKFISTELIVGEDFPIGLEKHLDLNAESRKRIFDERNQKFNGERMARWQKRVEAAKERRAKKNNAEPQQNAAPEDGSGAASAASSGPAFVDVLGAKKGLTILVQFPLDPNPVLAGIPNPASFPTTQAKIDRYCNETGYVDDGNTGSVKDYFFDQSQGLMTYTMSVTPIVTMPQPRNYYNFSNYPTNTILRDSGDAGNILIIDAITVLKSQGFNFNGLTLDGENVRSTNILYAGPDSGVWSEGLWPHAWGMYSNNGTTTLGYNNRPTVTVDGVARRIHRYQITNLNSAAPVIGTFAHESSHLILDMPDLYDTNSGNGGSRGLDRHCLMSGGNYSNNGKTPAPINLYLKDTVGWATITDIGPAQFADTNLPATGNVGYRIINPASPAEFFVIENRSYASGAVGGDKWAQYGHDQGIMIWHVDENVTTDNQNQQMTAAQHYLVSLEQQDGLFELENNTGGGDTTDLYDNISLEFNDGNTPNANWWSGAASGIKIKVNSAVAASMNVVFGTALPANTIKVTSPNGGETIYSGTIYNITWNANITGNVKIELVEQGGLTTTIIANTANSSSYQWLVPGGLSTVNGYKIKISSVNTPATTDSSDANFNIGLDPLATALDTTNLAWSTSGNLPWFLQTATTNDGVDAAQSGAIADSQTSSMETTVVGPGTLTFYWKVSSETSFDFLRFYINNVEQTGSLARISGEVNWIQKTVVIPAGNQTIKWSYTKDSSVSTASDAAWVDQVVYTPDSGTPSYTVSYNGNGNTGGTAPVNQTKTQGVNITLSNKGSLVRTGYTFAGWNTLSTGNGTDYAEGSVYSTDATVTMYAKWSAIPTYTVSYNGNGNTGGSPPGNQTKTQGVNITLSNKGSLVRTGYTFAGWNTLSTGNGTDYAEGSVYSTDATVTMYAKWTIIPTYTVSYNGNGNTGGSPPGNQTKTQGVNITLSNKGSLVRTGYTFVGWNTLSTGNGTDYAEGSVYSTDQTVTMYAKWTALPTYTVIYNGNGNTGGSPPANQTKIQDVDLTLSNQGSLTRAGYTFVNWNTSATGNGTSYNAGANYSNNANLTLYAQWSVTIYTVTYDGNGSTAGTVPVDNNDYNTDDIVTVLGKGSLTRAPYTFSKWNTAIDGSGTDYNAGNTFSITSDVTLYAQWNPGPLAIYEPFDDTNSTLTGNTPGLGLSGFWAGTGVVVSPTSLSYGNLPAGSGNKVTISNQTGNISVGNTLANNGLLANGSNLWFSVLVKTGGDIGTNGDFGFAFGTDPINSGNNVPMTNSGSALGFTFKNSQVRASHWAPALTRSSTNTTNAAIAETTYLIVGKITWGATTDTIEIYKAPTNLVLGAANSTITANIDQSLIDTITFASKGSTPAHEIDEIRVGSTYEAVIGITTQSTLDHFAISPISQNQTVGVPITGITITAQDATNQTVTNFTGTVTYAGTAGITGNSANFVNGVITNVSLTPTNIGIDRTLTVTDGTGHEGLATFNVLSLYDSWSGSLKKDDDTNGDGITNGMAWALGAADPSADATGLMPTIATSATHFIFTYRRNDEVLASPGVTLAMQYGTDIASWINAASGTNVTITETNDFYEAGVDRVEVRINLNQAPNGILFGRLKLDIAP